MQYQIARLTANENGQAFTWLESESYFKIWVLDPSGRTNQTTYVERKPQTDITMDAGYL